MCRSRPLYCLFSFFTTHDAIFQQINVKYIHNMDILTTWTTAVSTVSFVIKISIEIVV